MTSIWNVFVAFWSAYGPWIATALIPTIITGLSISPKTAAEASFMQKAWDYLKKLMDVLSVATHKDVPGTFKLPLNIGKLVKKDSAGPVAMLVIILLSGSILNTSCSLIKGDATEAAAIIIDCSKQEVSSKAADLLPTILSVLTGNTTSWVSQLEAFGKQFGEDVLACAVSEAQQKLFGEVPPGAERNTEDPTVRSLNRSRQYIAAKHWVYQ